MGEYLYYFNLWHKLAFDRIVSLHYSNSMANSRRDKADSYTQKAHKEGYPARSVYKLEEINNAHKLIKPGDSVLDVGAAPGSWTLFTHRELIKGNGKIVSIDLNPLSLQPMPPTVTEIVGDAFSKENRARLVELCQYLLYQLKLFYIFLSRLLLSAKSFFDVSSFQTLHHT